MVEGPIAPYKRARAGRRIRPFSLAFVLAYSAVTGALVALLPAQLLFLLGLPIAVAIVVILWLLPDGGVVPTRLLGSLLVWFVGAYILWPNYIALDLPGLPWINPPRVIAFLLLVIGLYTFSTSSTMRREIGETLKAVPYLRYAFLIFWCVSFVTIILSNQPVFSFNKWINNQIFWTFAFALSAWLATKGGFIARVARVIAWTTILVALETIYESHVGQVPWMDHIPSFLTVDPTYLASVYKTQGRAGTDIYRARGTFSVSLVCAEFMAIAYPILIHMMITSKEFWRKTIMFCGLVAVLSAMWLTNARSGMIGFFMAVFLYGGVATYRHWRRNKQSLAGVSALAIMPVLAVAFLGLSLTWPRLHNMTFGGAQHQPSTEARSAQWALGLPKVERNPVGHGPGSGGQVLGYANLDGILTIDTYYLSVLLEYGVVGFLAFLVMFGGQTLTGLRLYLQAPPGEANFIGPITIALLNFLVIKAVASTEFNIPIVFIMLGFVFACARIQQMRNAPLQTLNVDRGMSFGRAQPKLST